MNYTLKKIINSLIIISLFLSCVIMPQSHADGYMRPGVTYLTTNRDAIFKVCNRSDQTLWYAIIYKNYWKFGEPATWPAKSWFKLNIGNCNNIGLNGLFGVLSVITEDNKPYYSSGTISLKEITTYNNEVKKFRTEYFCLGNKLEDPIDDTYRDSLYDYRECNKGQEKIPFNIIFNIKGDSHYTLNLE